MGRLVHQTGRMGRTRAGSNVEKNKICKVFGSVSLFLGNVANMGAIYANHAGEAQRAQALIIASIGEIARKVERPHAQA